MNAILQPYRLTERGGAGLARDEQGVALGGVDLVRARLDENGVTHCDVRSPSEFARIVQTAYGPLAEAEILRLHRGLRRAAAWIKASDIAQAGIEAVMLGLPDLEPDAMAKMADLEKAANPAWENEPRLPAGQSGGGQWTTGGGSATPAAPVESARPERSATRQRPATSGETGAVVTGRQQVADAPAQGLLVPVSTAAAVASPPDMAANLALPESVTRMGRAALLDYAAGLLDQLHDAAVQEQVTNAIARFSLNPGRPRDVMAATAYVWAENNLGFLTAAPFSGPSLKAASEAVMRCVLLHPGLLPVMLDRSSPQWANASALVMGAANAGLADFTAENRARPPGVAPELQTTSRAARAAIADQLKSGRMQAHHLVPAYNWGARVDISALALDGGWLVNSPNNLIALPTDLAAQAEHQARFGEWLPVHNGSHPSYNAETAQLIEAEEAQFGSLTPLEARAIMEEVARINKVRLLAGAYGPIVRVGS